MTLLRLTEEQAGLANDVRAFAQATRSPSEQSRGLRRASEDETPLEWERGVWRQLGERGWLGFGIPMEYGGSGGTPIQRHIVTTGLSYHGIPYPRTAITIVAPAILNHGSEEMKRKYLPRIAGGDLNFALGYSEPDAGSDLASLSTRARWTGNEFRITGQKIYTTRAHRSDLCFLAARTDSEAAKHAGISLFVVDLHAPGVEITPLPVMNGECTNFTYYDDVAVPLSDLVGEENRGWDYLTGALGYERIGVFPLGFVQRVFRELVEVVVSTRPDGVRPADGQRLRTLVAELQVDLHSLERMFEGALLVAEETGDIPGYVAAEIKVLFSELQGRIADTALEALGPFGQVLGGEWAHKDGLMEALWRDGILETFGAGTNEIQRDIIARRGLCLPNGRVER